MRTHAGRPLAALAMLLAVLVLAAGAPGSAGAREGAYVGIGTVFGQQPAGDLDGSGVSGDATTGLEFRRGELDAGNGLVLEGGFGFTPMWGVDLLYLTARHTATFTDSTGAKAETDAEWESLLVGARASFQVGEPFDLFLRAGLGGHTLKIDDNAFDTSAGGASPVGASAPVGASTFTGNGAFYGVGVEVLMGNLGVELSSLYQQVRFDRFEVGGRDGDLDPELDVPVATYLLLLTYRFR